MAEWSFPAIGGNDQSAWRCGGDFNAVTPRSSHFALERGFAGGCLPALPRTGLRFARRVRARCHSEERRRQGRWSGRLGIFRAGTPRADAPLGSDGTCRQPSRECEREGTLECRGSEPGCGRNRGGRAALESPRNVPPRWRERTVDGIALGFAGDTGIGLVGLLSRVSSGRGGGGHGGAAFFGGG